MTKHLLVISSLCILFSACENNKTVVQNDRNQPVIEKTNETEEDRSITNRIREAISRDTTLTDSRSIQVSTSNGTVTLKGTIANDSEKNDLTRKIKGMHGVKTVDNQLEVNQ
ncbi:MAG: BON domain-containing protein [Parachlamydiaceae bacterium]|nr:BON domain-containing protein [Parachlamydiaceae bacterium]